jgi:nicotinamidase-related amidase
MKKNSSMKRISRSRSVFLCCDIQSIFQQTIHRFNQVEKTASLLVQAAKIFDIPVVVSEQYPEKLGRTVTCIDTTSCCVYSKTIFSMIVPDFPDKLLKCDSFILFGIEAHVCVHQTALDLLERGKHVILVTDAISSSRELDRSTALANLSRRGADLMSAESVMFELLKTKDAPEFKEISKIAKELSTFYKDSKGLVLSSL